MAIKSSVPATMIEAYKGTDFRVCRDPVFTLRVGKLSPELREVYIQQQVTCAAFITAWNPYSIVTSEEENIALQARLEACIAEAGYKFWPGLGVDPSGKWHGEPSAFVLGLDMDKACSFGTDFRQNAIVWIGETAVPELIMLR